MARKLIPLLYGVIAGPPAILLHELGHYVVALAFGFPGLELHSTSIHFSHTPELLTSWKLAVEEIAGPAVSLLLIFAAALWGKGGWRIAVALAASWRFAATGAVAALLLLRAILRKPPTNSNVDEYNVARVLGINPYLVIVSVLAAVFAGLFLVWRVTPKGERLLPALGVGLSTVLYLTLLKF